MKRKTTSLWIILLAIMLAIISGSISGKETKIFNITLFSIFDVIGQMFINALMLVVIPLVASSIICGISKIKKGASLKVLGIKTLFFFTLTNLLAIFTALLCINLFKEPLSRSAQGIAIVTLPADVLVMKKPFSIVDIILQIIPSNIVDAFSKGQMLGLIFFSLIFGFAITKISPKAALILKGFWEGIFQVMIEITHLIMKFLPIGVFCLVAKQFALNGTEALRSLSVFSIIIVGGLIFFIFAILFPLLKVGGKINPIYHFQAMTPALTTAFSTTSTSATLPITIDCIEKRVGISNDITSIVIPLSASLNMAGSAFFVLIATSFTAITYGFALTFKLQLIIVLLTFLATIGVAGVPSAALVATIVVLKGIGLPAESIAFFVAIDRILDMFRTTTNVFTNSTSAVLIARSEGEKFYLKS